MNPESSQQSFFTTGEIFQKLDECQIAPEIHCSSWRCNAMARSRLKSSSCVDLGRASHAYRCGNAVPKTDLGSSGSDQRRVLSVPDGARRPSALASRSSGSSEFPVSLTHWVSYLATLNRNTVYGNDSSISTRKYV